LSINLSSFRVARTSAILSQTLRRPVEGAATVGVLMQACDVSSSMAYAGFLPDHGLWHCGAEKP
jgi:hypothetical protein